MCVIYQADVYCDDCGRDIVRRLKGEGKNPADFDDENLYDSDEYPKDGDDDEESDSPQHCGNGADCVNAIVLSDGSKVGCLIGTNLTSEGMDYVREAVQEGGMVAREVWRDEFDYIDFP